MKATIDIPDELYYRVKARSALLGRTVREVTTELYRHWLGDVPAETTARSSAEWLDEWVALGDRSLQDAPEGPTATEIVAADRGRLDRPC